MSFYIDDDELTEYYSKISFLFKNIKLIREHLDIIFVFGSAPSDNSGRTLFMKYIEGKETPFDFVTIERLYEDLRTHAFTKRGAGLEKIKLAELEYKAIKNAFSVLIFPESPGSYAELGYFSAREDTRRKIIVSNKLKYYRKQTYVNSVVDFIHEDKEIKQLLYTKEENESHFETYITDLLDSYKNYHEEVFKNIKKIKNNHMYSLGVLYELIRLFPNLIYTELLFLVKHAFKELVIEIDEIEDYLKSMISLLVICNLVERKILSNHKKVFKVIDDNFSCFKIINTEQEHLKVFLHINEIIERKTV